MKNVCVAVCALLAVGCGAAGAGSSSSGSTAEVKPACDGAVDYECDVAPLIEKHCISCHAAGGIGPIQLDTYEHASVAAAAMKDAVVSKRMPPWPPEVSSACPPLLGSRAMPVEDIATLEQWAANGAVRGVVGSRPTPSSTTQAVDDDPLGVPDQVLKAGTGYTPNQSRTDDYRCFIVDPGYTADTYLHGYEVKPGNKAIVHHVLVYGVMPESVAELNQWDAADPEVGFECFGSPAPGIPITLGGWVPGQRPQKFRKGDGAWIPAGSRLVIQMHYNLLGGGGLDETNIEMHYVHGQPFREVGTLPFPLDGFRIPAGDASYTYADSFAGLPDVLWSGDLDLRLEGVAPHMHKLGTAIHVNMAPPGGQESCLINVPKWDFSWQGFYLFDGAEPMAIPRNAAFTLSCSWDNSEENQPIINGVRQAPRAVEWGEGTNDEMCLAFLIVSGKPGWTAFLLSLVNN